MSQHDPEDRSPDEPTPEDDGGWEEIDTAVTKAPARDPDAHPDAEDDASNDDEDTLGGPDTFEAPHEIPTAVDDVALPDEVPEEDSEPPTLVDEPRTDG